MTTELVEFVNMARRHNLDIEKWEIQLALHLSRPSFWRTVLVGLELAD